MIYEVKFFFCNFLSFIVIYLINTIHYICKECNEELLSYPNVVGVGFSYKTTQNIQTDTPAICVLVSKKEPLENLDPSSIIPKNYKGIQTDVIEIGEVFAYGLTSKIRPMEFGYSIGIKGISAAGTAGCMVSSKSNPNIRYILSNNHVLANINTTRINAPILQPSKIDGGLITDTVAALAKYIPLQFESRKSSPTNTVDCAIAQLNPVWIAIPQIANIGIPKGIISPYVNQEVKKSGRTTGFTTGVIIATGVTVKVNYGPGKIARFTNQIVSTAMSSPGNSGSLLLDTNNFAVGLLFAGSSSVTIYNPISTVLNALNVNLVIG